MSPVQRWTSDDTFAVPIEDSNGWNPVRDAEPSSCDHVAHAVAVSATATTAAARVLRVITFVAQPGSAVRCMESSQRDEARGYWPTSEDSRVPSAGGSVVD